MQLESLPISFFPSWQEFLGRDVLLEIRQQRKAVWNKLLSILEALKQPGHPIRSAKCVKRYDGDIMELKLGGHSTPVRLFLVPCRQGSGYWIVYACKKNQQALPSRDDSQVRYRAEKARSLALA